MCVLSQLHIFATDNFVRCAGNPCISDRALVRCQHTAVEILRAFTLPPYMMTQTSQTQYFQEILQKKLTQVEPGFGKHARQLSVTHYAAKQLWFYEHGYIKSLFNRLALDVKGNAQTSGAEVIMWNPTSNATNQIWTFENGYLVSQSSAMVLAIPHTDAGEGVHVSMSERLNISEHSVMQQLWTWDTAGVIALLIDPQYVLGISGDASPGSYACLTVRKPL